jgi:flagellar hook assembly protein FlgD/outer membrane protein OmpA-like peptidoglycan-associated protein
MKKTTIAIIVALFAVVSAFGEIPDKAGEFYSPVFLGGGAFVTSFYSPQGDMINPAASALNQRVTLDISYLTLAGSDGDVSGLGGHAVNVGSTIPTKGGVFSFTGHYFNSSFSQFPGDKHLTFSSGFSKELYPNLSTGLGLNLGFGGGGIAAALDIGFIHQLGPLGFLKDFRWGVVAENLGYHTIEGAYPPPFGLRGGVRGTLIDSHHLAFSVSSDIGFPGFSNVQWALGGELEIASFLSITTASRMDLSQVLDGDYSQFIPSVGIVFSFTTDISDDSDFLGLSERGWNRSEVNSSFAVAPVYENVWGVGAGLNIPLGVVDNEPPEISIDLGAIRMTPPESEPEEGSQEGDEAENQDEEPDETTGAEDISSFDKGSGRKTGSSSVAQKRYVSEKGSLGRKTKKIVHSVDVEKEGGQEKLSEKGESEEAAISLDDAGEKRFPGEDIIAWISPNNDGIQDDLTIPIAISDSRYVYSYRLVLENEAGEIVRVIENKDKREENEGFRGFFDRLFSVKKGIDIPQEIRWDGTGEDGSVVADGLYRFHVEAFDDNGNRGKTESYSIVIDKTPPVLELEEIKEEDKIFSPNDDGFKDWVSIDQTGSVERRWSGEIKDGSGRVVREEVWSWKSPEPFIWDGTDDKGILVPDGVYSYAISSTDLAGNSEDASINNFIKNTTPTPVSLSLERSHFSPNGDGVKDRVILEPEVPVSSGIDFWSVEILNSRGEPVRVYQGEKGAPGSISFDGKDDSGILLPEGAYRGKLSLFYINGNRPSGISPEFIIDLTPPEAQVRLSDQIFSPDGDGIKDTISFYQETSLEELWEGKILKVDTEEGKPREVSTFRWIENAPAQLAWDGTGDDGTLSDDGTYMYYISSTDRAGNSTKSSERSFRLDTSKTPVIITAELSAFSPNGDGVKDTITLFPKLDQNSEISSYQITISNEDERVVRTISGTSSMRETYIWDGTDDKNRAVADGLYKAHLEVAYLKGNKEESNTRPFLLDTLYPEAEMSAEYLLFSPDDDGRKDLLRIEQRSSSETLWSGEIRNSSSGVVKRAFWKGELGNFQWDGTGEAGNSVPDGSYSYHLSSQDEAGNLFEKSMDGIEVDTKATSIFVTVDAQAISPTGNGMFEEIGFTTIVNNKKGIENWKLELLRDGSTVEKLFSGDNRIPSKIVWNGRAEDGRYREGEYIARFTVSYEKGNLPVAETSTFVLDRSAPLIAIEMDPIPFSPDNDGVDDELTIRIDLEDQSDIKQWSLQIYDPEAKPFKRYQGTGMPAETIIWDGVSGDGELVYAAMDYPYRFIAEDAWGNRSVSEGRIPVDVLVVREGNLLKIKIASIIFQPNRAEFAESDPEVKERNSYVLDRIAEILDKYKNYTITVEGHAALINWRDPVKAEEEERTELQPLSQLRAERVVRALVERGIEASRLEAIGAGGTKPLVPHSDTENRWKNRRVEFILEKKR